MKCHATLLIILLISATADGVDASCSGSLDVCAEKDDLTKDDREMRLKVKNFCNTYPLSWSVGNTSIFYETSFCGLTFDGISDAVSSDCDDGKRQMKVLSLSITDNGEDGQFLLGNIPVTFTLTFPDKTTDIFNYAGEVLRYDKLDDSKCTCTENTYQLRAAVKYEDVLISGAIESEIAGEFTMKVWRPGHATGPLCGRLPFKVTLSITPAIQIAHLDNMTLNASGGTQDFCVFAIGTDKFRLKANGKNDGGDPPSFRLTNGTSTIPYSMTINDDNNKFCYFNEPGECSGLKPTHQRCDPATCNMSLSIKLDSDAGKATSGVYSDTMELTVSPD